MAKYKFKFYVEGQQIGSFKSDKLSNIESSFNEIKYKLKGKR